VKVNNGGRFPTHPFTDRYRGPSEIPAHWWVALAWFTCVLLFVVIQLIVTLARPVPPMLPGEGGTIYAHKENHAAS
jgi:hypothetical protein